MAELAAQDGLDGGCHRQAAPGFRLAAFALFDVADGALFEIDIAPCQRNAALEPDAGEQGEFHHVMEIRAHELEQVDFLGGGRLARARLRLGELGDLQRRLDQRLVAVAGMPERRAELFERLVDGGVGDRLEQPAPLVVATARLHAGAPRRGDALDILVGDLVRRLVGAEPVFQPAHAVRARRVGAIAERAIGAFTVDILAGWPAGRRRDFQNVHFNGH